MRARVSVSSSHASRSTTLSSNPFTALSAPSPSRSLVLRSSSRVRSVGDSSPVPSASRATPPSASSASSSSSNSSLVMRERGVRALKSVSRRFGSNGTRAASRRTGRSVRLSSLRRQDQVGTQRVEPGLLAEPPLPLGAAFGLVHLSDPVDSEPVALAVDHFAERHGVLAAPSDERGVVPVADRAPLVLVEQFAAERRRGLAVVVALGVVGHERVDVLDQREGDVGVKYVHALVTDYAERYDD